MSYPVPYTWTVSGILLQNGTPFSQGKLEAYNRLADGSLDWIAECSPAGDGSYSLIFSSSAFQKGDNSIDHPNLVIRLYDYQNNLLWESDTYAAMDTPFEMGTIDISIASADDIWNIQGTVFYSSASPLSAGTVYVYDIWNGQTTLLTQASLNTKGYFSCSYPKSAFQKQGAARSAPNLQIIVRDSQGRSLTTYNVPDPVSVNQVVNIPLGSVPDSLTNEDCKVYGTVKNTLNYPLKDDITVAAFCLYYQETIDNGSGDKSGKFIKVMLGTPVVPDTFGHYEIDYRASAIPQGLKLDSNVARGKDKASLYAEVHYAKGGTTPSSGQPRSFYSAPLVFNGQSVQEINFVLDLETDKPYKSEFEALDDLLQIYYQTIISNTETVKYSKQDKIAEFLENVTQLPLVVGRESLTEEKVRAYFKAFQLAHELTVTVKNIELSFKAKYQDALNQGRISQEEYARLTSEQHIVYLNAQYLYPIVVDCGIVDLSTLLSLGVDECSRETKKALKENIISASLSADEFKNCIWMNLQTSDEIAQEQEDTFSPYFFFYLLLTNELDLYRDSDATGNVSAFPKKGKTGRPKLSLLESKKTEHSYLLREYVEAGSNYRDLIVKLKKDSGILEESVVDDLELLVDLADFCNWYSDLVVCAYQTIKTNSSYTDIHKLEDILLLHYNTRGFWETSLGYTTTRYHIWCKDAPLSLPIEFFPGTESNEQFQIAVRTLKDRLKAKYPQADLNTDILESFSTTDAAEKPWHDLFAKLRDSEAWKGFDLNSSDLDTFLSNSAAAHEQDDQIPEATATESEKEQIRTLQRLYRLTNDPEAIAYLIKNNFDSAAKIALIDEERFVAEHGLGMGDKELAANIHRLSKNFVANATLDIERFHGSLNEADDAIISLPRGLRQDNAVSSPKRTMRKNLSNSRNVATQRLQSKSYANWKTLFGRINRNSGTQNQSILSASAYLLDLLEFLKQGHAYSRFISRRPDVLELKMTKANAEVSLPTIDLAIELLESLVSKSHVSQRAIPLCNQTPEGATVQDLRANPCPWASGNENVESNAMAALSSKCYPMNLPKNFEREKVSAILKNLSLDFATVASKLHEAGNKALLLDGNQSETLKVTETENAIYGKADLWGLEDYGNVGLFFPDKSRQIESSCHWYDVLCNLAFVLDRAKLTYDEFAEILTSSVFQDSGATLKADSESFQLADVNGYTLTFNSDNEKEDFFYKLSVFVRRRMVLGWTIEDVAKTWDCDVDDLVEIYELKTKLGLTAQEAAILLGKYTLTGDDLENIFPIDSLFDEYGSGFDESERNDETLRYQLATAAKVCLEIDLQDALLILQQAWFPNTYPTAEGALEAGLITLYKNNLWIRKNNLSVEDYFFLKSIGFPVAFGSRDYCKSTIDNLDLLKNSSLSMGDLKSIFKPLLMSSEDARAFAEELKSSVKESLKDWPSRECLTDMQLTEIDYDTSILGLLKTLGYEEAEKIYAVWKSYLETNPEDVSEEVVRYLETSFENVFRLISIDYDDPNHTWLSTIENVENFYDCLREELFAEQIITVLSEKFSFEAAHLFELLQQLISNDSDNSTCDWNLWKTKISNDEADVVDLCNHIIRCAALHQFTQTLDLGFEWDWSVFAIVNESSYETIKNVIYAFAASSQILGEVYKYGELGDLEVLDKKLQIPSEAATALFAKAGIVFEQGDDGSITSVSIDSPSAWCWFADLLYLYKKTNTLPLDLVNLLEVDGQFSAGCVIKFENNLKLTRTNSEWNKFIQDVNDKIRQLKRDALAAVVCNESQRPDTAANYPVVFVDENDIYSYYLLDVKMEPDMAISRTVQAVSCIQLYVQRALMGLEGGYTLNDTQKDQWEWMKNYQVWVANRKVFLYPENWIDGDLRSDKTPFFLEFEERLAEIGNDQDALSEALGEYIKKVCDTAEMDIVGACKQDGGSASGVLYTLHIVGRTRGEPHAYYYRKYEATALYGGTWTPWEELPIEIDGAAVQPAILGGHLYILWLQIVQGQRQKKTGESSNGASATVSIEYYAEIRLKWSSYTGVKWTGVKVGKQAIYDVSENQLDFILGDDESLADRYFIIDESANSDALNLEIWRTFSECKDTKKIVAVPMTNTSRDTSDAQDLTGVPASSYVLKTEISREYNDNQLINRIGNITLTVDGADSISYEIDKSGKHIGFDYGEYVKNHVPQNCRLIGNMFYSKGGSLVLQDGTKILGNTRGSYKLLSVNMGFVSHKESSFFYMDSKGTYLVRVVSGDGGAGANSIPNYSIEMVSNPQAGEFRRRYLQGGAKWLYNRETEALPVSDSYYYSYSYYNYYFSVYLGYYTAGDWQAWDLSQTLFEHNYLPSSIVAEPYPSSTVDFCWGSATSIYNWELFFFVPMLLADKMLAEQNYEAALNWLQLVFDPRIDLTHYERTKRFVRDLSKGAKYWKFLPFFANQDADRSILSELSFPTPHDALPDRKAILLLQDRWKNDPFDPQMIARYRPVAYQKYVVMKYLDALIGWGDQLFTQDTTESVNLAIQMYILAAEILGPKSAQVPDPTNDTPFTVEALLQRGMGVMNNAFVTYEDTMLTGKCREKETPQRLLPGNTMQLAHTTGMMFYFNVPRNETLMGYWDTVADRLYKIRNSLNIEGVKRTLALFAPPIDPAMLVKAKAGGVSISEALADASSALPYYRFKVMVAKAIEIVRDVQRVGQELMDALEKIDAETLALLRVTHEKTAVTLQKTLAELDISELEKELEAVETEEENLQMEQDQQKEFFKKTEKETKYEKAMEKVKKVQETVENMKKAAGIAYKIPDLGIGGLLNGFGGPSFDAVALGGTKIAENLVNLAEGYASKFAQKQVGAALQKVLGEQERVEQSWTMQKTAKANQLKNVQKKKIITEIKIDYAKRQLENLEREIELKDEMFDHLSEKYTNKDLYNWLKKETGSVYKTLFQLAVKVARKAEKCYHFEIGDTDEDPKSAKSFIKGSGSYWDGLHSGLLAGEKLLADLHAMEVAYLENDRNELEITRPVSLWELEKRQGTDDLDRIQAPLTDIQGGGYCEFTIPEKLFSSDFSNQYFRRIRSVMLEIIAPNYRGHYLNAQLSLTENWLDLKDEDEKVGNRIGTQTMATSTAHQESGKFEFRFGLDKFLPFEGAGAVDSKWSLEITGFDNTRIDEPGTNHNLDFSKIEDVVIHISYTARMGKIQKEAN